MERRHRNRKKKHIFGDKSQDSGLPYDIELRTEMFSSLDRVIQEINSRFQQLHELAENMFYLLLHILLMITMNVSLVS